MAADIGDDLFHAVIDAGGQAVAGLDSGGAVDQGVAFGQKQDQPFIQRVDVIAQTGHVGDIVDAGHGPRDMHRGGGLFKGAGR